MIDIDYIAIRNRFIPFAENYADDQTRKLRWSIKSEADREAWTATWNKIYHRKMNELAKNL